MSKRVLAFVALVSIAALAGFAAGRATSYGGAAADAWAPDGSRHLRVKRAFSLGPKDERLVLEAGGETTEIRVLATDEEAGEIVWAPDGSFAGVVVNGATLVVVDPAGRRVVYELPLLDQRDGSRIARGLGFSANGRAVTFDDCPRRGAGCRPRVMALPLLR